MQHALDAIFDDQIALRGFDLDSSRLEPGGTLRLVLYWQALATPTASFTVFTHLLDEGERVVAQQDNQPARGTSPTLTWLPGQVTRDEYVLQLSPEAKSGQVIVEVGLYDAASGTRLRLVGGSGEDRVILSTLPVVSSANP
jgi:hypothetical protein